MKLFICLFALVATVMTDTNSDLLKSANEQFTANLFGEAMAWIPNSSLVLSAFSLLSPLAQLALASEGPSHDEILKAIGMPNDDVTKQVIKDMGKQLRSVKGVELKLASRVYVGNDAELDDEFNAMSRDVFNSDAKSIDFSNDLAAADEINAWVEDQTNHRIKNLVDPILLRHSPQAVLVNAIYFKGEWSKPFPLINTENKPFHLSLDETIKLPMMYKSDNLKYGESEALEAKLLELPYVGGETSLLIVLPNKIDGINALIPKLRNPAVLNKAIDEMRNTEVNVYLPRVKIESRSELDEILRKVGVEKLFTSEAKVTKLLKGKSLEVSSAIQRAYIEVNEQGSEAAAANAFHGFLTPSFRPQILYKQFKIDHPFYFEVRKNTTALFNGCVFHP
ncbi:antichymotrypsin-2-like isoform X3 [Trichoplusia ni]|uniref:Antichymotrypsin-2-like isoform X3 n=1 Tax=Trichoplusia ni TaxID=7111 RepID=A0A7E5VM42_TRINI|nr:antichymotrypsin-2-like isoform X3 [Trichoplusia ni]